MSDTIESLKEAEKEAVIETNQPRQVSHHNNNMTGGLILIGLGVFFLVSRVGGVFLHNWWALFILIPAFHNINEAIQNYHANGRLTKHGRNSLTGGIMIGTVAAFFLFNLSWSIFWPIMLIMVGLCALMNGRS